MSINIDLDIENYKLEDIEKYLKLEKYKSYSVNDVEMKAYEIREQLMNSDVVNKEMKRDLIVFTTAAKDWLLFTKFGEVSLEPFAKNRSRNMEKKYYDDEVRTKKEKLNMNVTSSIQDPNRSDEIYNRDRREYIYTNNQEFFEGNLNPLDKRIINRSLSIDTKFRNNYDNTKSTDFYVQLPSKINKVVEMQIANIELPMVFYNISGSYGNNFLYLEICVRENEELIKKSTIILLEDGVYNATSLIERINSLLKEKTDEFSKIELSIDIDEKGNGTGKTIIETNDDKIVQIVLNFENNLQNLPDQVDIRTKIGWNLGFTKKYYKNRKRYVSDKVIDMKTIKYIYLAIDDFQKSVNNLFLEGFENRTINENIIAKIILNSDDFTLFVEKSLNMITEKRNYFGPVDLQRLHITMYDDNGRIINLNNSDYSFVLNLKVLYDL